MATFVFDEDVPSVVAEALRLVGYDAHHVRGVKGLSQAAEDTEIIDWCAKNRAVWVTADWKARTTKKHQALLRGRRVSVAWFRPPSKSGWTRKEWFRVVVHWIERMESDFAISRPRWCRYTSKTRQEISL